MGKSTGRTRKGRATSAKRRSTKAAGKRKAAAKVSARRKPAVAKSKPRRAATPRTDPVREVAKRIVDLTLTNNDGEAFALYADNVESREMGMAPMTGIDAIKQKFAMWRGMVSDSSWRATNVWVDGNTIIIEWEGRITLAQSGRVVSFPEIAIHQVEGGKIVRERFYYDPSVLQQ